jgi:hypothetical protein
MLRSVKGTITYEFSAKLWRHPGQGGWYFMSLPQEMSAEIRKQLKWQEEGWGRLRCAAVKIGATTWETAIWFDAKQETYILPVKKEIRKKEKLEENTDVMASLSI